jgi:rhodanese-related sulfurtransferase
MTGQGKRHVMWFQLLFSGQKEIVMNKRTLVALVAVFVIFGTGNIAVAADKTPDQLVKEAKASIKEVSISEVKGMIDTKEKIILLDVRDKNEFETGSIPGAVNLSRGMLEFKVAALIPDKTEKIVVFCAIDLRGPLATKALNDLGYKNAVNMIGGLKVWKEAGYPIGK